MRVAGVKINVLLIVIVRVNVMHAASTPQMRILETPLLVMCKLSPHCGADCLAAFQDML